MKITFIGLGIMGSRMATNLLKSDHELTVFNRNIKKIDPLVEKGAIGAASLPEAVEHADIIITMLSNPEAVSEIARGENGILNNASINSVWIDCSTVNPSFSKKTAGQASDHQILYIDAPVAGSRVPAEKGELTFLVGGNKNVFKKIKPVLETMGNKIIHAGETGMGSASKMVVNLMLGQAMLSYAEALVLGQNLGLDNEFLIKKLPQMPVAAPFLKFKAEKIGQGNGETDFPLKHMVKDLHLAGQTGYEKNVSLPALKVAEGIYALASSHGLGEEDFSAVFEFISDKKN